MHRAPHFALCLSLLVASAAAFTPLVRRHGDGPWTPARETHHPDDRIGWSPKPTDAPLPPPRYGEIDLLRRQEFSMGTATCGFVQGYDSAEVTCVRESAYCTNDGAGNMDCCTGAYSLCTTSMFSACLDYSASQRGACSSKGPRTICCWEASPSCYTLLFSTSATPNQVYSIFQCQSSGGIDSLLPTPPKFARTATSSGSSSSSTSTSSSTTRPAPGPTTPIGGGDNVSSGDSTPIGAIVGGVVGGVALIALAAFLIFFFLIRKKRNVIAPAPATQQQPPTPGMAQTSQSTYQNPAQYQQYPPHQQQPQYAPAQTPSEYKPYPDQQQQDYYGSQQQQQQQQPGYPTPPGPYGYPASTVNSGLAGTTPTGSTSPGPQNQGYPQPYGPAQGGPYPNPPQPVPQHFNAMELPVQNPLGTAGHRAELGGQQ